MFDNTFTESGGPPKMGKAQASVTKTPSAGFHGSAAARLRLGSVEFAAAMGGNQGNRNNGEAKEREGSFEGTIKFGRLNRTQ